MNYLHSSTHNSFTQNDRSTITSSALIVSMTSTEVQGKIDWNYSKDKVRPPPSLFSFFA